MAAIYHAPTDIAVAIDLLAEMNEKTVVVAGGTEVTRRLRENRDAASGCSTSTNCMIYAA